MLAACRRASRTNTAGGLIEGVLQRGEFPAPVGDDAAELLTLLFADIRGYTRFTQDRGDEALCVFTSPRRGLRLAVALQQRFVEETVADAELPLTVGIGVDAGEAVHGPDGYRGGALNLAARLCARAKAGEVLASAEVTTHLARTIDGIAYVVLDRVSVKGLTSPVRLVRVSRRARIRSSSRPRCSQPRVRRRERVGQSAGCPSPSPRPRTTLLRLARPG